MLGIISISFGSCLRLLFIESQEFSGPKVISKYEKKKRSMNENEPYRVYTILMIMS